MKPLIWGGAGAGVRTENEEKEKEEKRLKTKDWKIMQSEGQRPEVKHKACANDTSQRCNNCRVFA